MGLVCLAAGALAEDSAVVGFAEAGSVTAENGTARLRVEFSREFTGTVAYRVEGSAERGSDFVLAADELRVEPSARAAEIVIDYS